MVDAAASSEIAEGTTCTVRLATCRSHTSVKLHITEVIS
jgi:hypothetical protein